MSSHLSSIAIGAEILQAEIRSVQSKLTRKPLARMARRRLGRSGEARAAGSIVAGVVAGSMGVGSLATGAGCPPISIEHGLSADIGNTHSMFDYEFPYVPEGRFTTTAVPAKYPPLDWEY